MPDLSVILQLLTLILMGLGGYLLLLFKTAAGAAVKASAEEGVKAAIRELEWTKTLAREFQRSRGVERQGLRFKAMEGFGRNSGRLQFTIPRPSTTRSLEIFPQG